MFRRGFFSVKNFRITANLYISCLHAMQYSTTNISHSFRPLLGPSTPLFFFACKHDETFSKSRACGIFPSARKFKSFGSVSPALSFSLTFWVAPSGLANFESTLRESGESEREREKRKRKGKEEQERGGRKNRREEAGSPTHMRAALGIVVALLLVSKASAAYQCNTAATVNGAIQVTTNNTQIYDGPANCKFLKKGGGGGCECT